jgi:hypothetical protein
VRGFLLGHLVIQKNEAIRTEMTLIHDQTIIATTTTMGKP